MISNVLSVRMAQLSEIANRAQADFDNSPEGFLDISTRHNRKQFRWKRPNKKVEYLRKRDRSIASQLAQKSYARKVLAQAKCDIRQIEQFLAVFPAEEEQLMNKAAMQSLPAHSMPKIGLSNIESIYDSLSSDRRSLVDPYITPLDSFIETWQSDFIEPGQIYGSGLLYETEKGERVRSKSEVIIADKLHRAGIPYKYEQPLEVSGTWLYPDFVILKTNTREEIYWEHFGLMDNPDYCNRCMKKLSAYSKEGLIPGRGLIATFETSSSPLDIRQIDQIIESIQSSYVAFSAYL